MGRALSTIPWTVATVTALSAIRSMLATGMALENPQEGVRDTILWMPPVDAHAATLEYCYQRVVVDGQRLVLLAFF